MKSFKRGLKITIPLLIIFLICSGVFEVMSDVRNGSWSLETAMFFAFAFRLPVIIILTVVFFVIIKGQKAPQIKS